MRTEYDESGRLKSLFDANGEKVELIYDPLNFVQRVKDVFGYETIYEYDERGNILTEIEPLGKVVKRTYNDDNLVLTLTVITSETGVEGWTTTWTYDDGGNKLSEEDPLGNVGRWTYNGLGQVLSETDALGNVTTYSYDSRGNLLSIKDAGGNLTFFSYDGYGNLISVTDSLNQTTEFKYNQFGYVERVIDPLKNETTYTYNSQGLKETETRKVTTPRGVQELVTEWKYDSSSRVQFVIDALQNVTEYQYDAVGNQIAVIDALKRKLEYKYDNKGQLIETIYPDDTPEFLADNPRTINVYDRGGRLRATIDESGYVTHYKYDAVGQLIETIYPQETDTLNEFISAVSPGKTVDSIDWTEVIYPDETPAYLSLYPRTKTEYYKTGEVKAEIDERGNRVEYTYNAAGQLVEVIYPDDTPETLADNPRIIYKYDDNGRVESEIDERNFTTSYVYDELGRVKETRYADKSYTVTTYNSLGQKVSFKDAAGKITRYEYDPLGRLTDVIQTLSLPGGTIQEIRTEYGYDEAGRLIWVEDASDNKTSYEYDKNGNRIATVLPLQQQSETTYNEVGLIERVTDFNGDTIVYKYDSQNRLTSKEFISSTQEAIEFVYTATGQVEKIIDSRGTTIFKYDSRGRLISRIDPDGPYIESGATIEYEYNDAGNITSVKTSSGITEYSYDEQNRLEKVIDSDNGVTSYEYDAAGNLSITEFPNGVVETQTYDELNRLKLLEYQKDGVTLQSFDYSLDPVGHRRVVTELNGRKVEYEYDDLYRLTSETIFSANGGVERTISYAYDAVGNRLTKTDSVNGVTIYTYDDNDRLLKEELRQNGVLVGSVEYGYDDNGNTQTKTKKNAAGAVEETLIYSWNQDNRLIGLQNSKGDVISYEYDADGVRVSQTVNGVTTEYLVDKNRDYAQVLEEWVNDTLIASYVYGLDLISQERGNADSYYLVDGLGSTRGLTDVGGVVTDTYNYDAFGNLIEVFGGIENDYLFAGEQFDENLEQYYLRQRYYDFETGRFIRRDTYEGSIYEPVSLHKYLYANGNPVNYIDPSGLITSTAEQSTNYKIIAILAGLSLITVALTGDTVQEEDSLKLTFYRGTTAYDAIEIVQDQHIDVERIEASQTRYGYSPDRQGVYFTSQRDTAKYYASYVGRGGKGGGPGVIIANVSEKQFRRFVIKYHIAVEAAVPNPPVPGQTETIIPYYAMTEFETFTTYILGTI